MLRQNDPVCSEKTYISLYNTYAKKLNNFVYYKCGDSKEAEDIVQESFVRLWKNCDNVPLEKARSFLFTVANNLFLNIVAHRKVVLHYARKNLLASMRKVHNLCWRKRSIWTNFKLPYPT